MSLISRVELLKLLQDTPEELKTDVGELFGFEMLESKSSTVEVIGMGRNARDGKLQEIPQQQYPFKSQFWYVDQYLKRKFTDQQEPEEHPARSELRQNQPKTAPLYSSAEQQNIWDRCLTQHHRYRGLNIPEAVKILAQAKPINQLPKQVGQHVPQETLIYLDRSEHLVPIWREQLELAESLEKLLGYEHSQVIWMTHGLNGVMRKKKRGLLSDWNWQQLPDSVHLLFITDLGHYSRNSDTKIEWQDKIEQLQNLGYQITVLTPLSHADTHFSCEQFSLDEKASRFTKLQRLMSGCLQAKLPRIRQFRQLIAGGSLEDELRLWNHPQRWHKPTGLEWRLAPEYLKQWHNAAQLNEDEQPRFQVLQERWRASMPMETEGLEQFIDEALNPDNINANAALLDSVLDAYRKNQLTYTAEYRFIVSQHDLLTALAPYQAGKSKWRRLFQYNQAAIQNKPIEVIEQDPLKILGQELNIQQLGEELKCSHDASRPIVSSNDFIFDLDRGRYIQIDSLVSGGAASLRTEQADIHLKTLTHPTWAERIWQARDGIYAAHSEHALFRLRPAFSEHAQAEWQCVYQPWSWASAAGIDNYGLWADLQIKKAVYRLRWIPSGRFLMGSPETEENRGDNEQQHLVILTQGYWLGETSCTQAFWQAVVGKNPSNNPESPQLPAEQVSWNDCQQFLSRLRELQPEFQPQLPSEAQWEFACRAGTATAYWWGDTMDEHYANNGASTKLENDYPANGFGLKSTSGNVREWCEDFYGEYVIDEQTDPVGQQQGHERVLRGGSWFRNGRNLRSAGRDASTPDFRYRHYGLRLAGGKDPQAGARPYAANRGPWNGQASGGVGPREPQV